MNQGNLSKKEAICKAIIDLVFQGKSVPEMTVAEIAAQAGIGKGTVYEYFPSKEKMIAAATVFYMNMEMAAVRKAVPLTQGFRGAMEAAVTIISQTIQNRFSLFQVATGFSCNDLDRSLAEETGALEELSGALLAEIRDILSLGEAEGLLSPYHPEAYQLAAFTGALGAFVACVQMYRMPEKEAMEYAYRILLLSLSGNAGISEPNQSK